MQSHISAEYLSDQGFSKTFPARFFSKIRFTDSCWIWTAHKNPKGYGEINTSTGNGFILAHRASWILHFGPIPQDMFVLHDCPEGDCASCVNPAHLWLGTRADNNADMTEKGRFNGMRPGQAHILHKLSDLEVLEIRERHVLGEMDSRIAMRFKVAQSTIHNIVNRKSWTHLP